jgi:hypothetical protein
VGLFKSAPPTSVQDFPLATGTKTIPHLPCSPDIAPEGFFIFPKVKKELAGFLLSQDSSKMRGVGVMQTIAEDEFATAFERWYGHCNKCIWIGNNK